MMAQPMRKALARAWPWLVLALTAVPSVWYVLDYDSDIDPEYPTVRRPTFSRFPPPAYRFADAGDTIDHVAVYVASAAIVLAGWGLLRSPQKRAWLAILACSLAGYWHAATPGPLLDGWHGLGWRIILDSRAHWGLRFLLAATGGLLLHLVLRGLSAASPRAVWNSARQHHVAGLLVVAALLMILRQTGWPNHEPIGFWPRWIYVWGLLAGALALVRLVPKEPLGRARPAAFAGLVLVWLLLDFTGRGIFWYQRPLHRLREVVPGQIYISAMPTRWGLELAQERHHFRTIINLFPEYTPERSPMLADELRFAHEHGLNYIGNEPDGDPSGGAFISRTLAAARDPASWPVLIHCHASMDRSPAWVGLYRFVVQGWPLADALRELEWHRGLRPKASVTLLYNRMIPRLAPERAAQDPTVSLLKECAGAVKDSPVGLMARPDRTLRPRTQARTEAPTKRR
jgi:hypothetical protein